MAEAVGRVVAAIVRLEAADRAARTARRRGPTPPALHRILKKRSAKFRALLQENRWENLTREERQALQELWLRGALGLERSERLRAGAEVAEEEEEACDQ